MNEKQIHQIGEKKGRVFLKTITPLIAICSYLIFTPLVKTIFESAGGTAALYLDKFQIDYGLLTPLIGIAIFTIPPIILNYFCDSIVKATFVLITELLLISAILFQYKYLPIGAIILIATYLLCLKIQSQLFSDKKDN